MIETSGDLTSRARDIFIVWTGNTLLMGVAWATANGFLTATGLIISIAYTLWRWRRDAQSKDNQD